MPKTGWQFLLQTTYGLKRYIFLQWSLILIGNSSIHLIPYFLRELVELAEATELVLLWSQVQPIVLTIIILMIVREVFIRLPHFMELIIVVKGQRAMFTNIYNTILFRPASYFEDRLTGEIDRKIYQVVTNALYFIDDLPWYALAPLVSFSIYSWLLYTVSFDLLILFLTWLAVFAVTSVPLQYWLFKTGKRSAVRDSKNGGESVDVLGNMSIVQSYASENRELQRLYGVFEQFLAADRSDRIANIMNKFHQGFSISLIVILLVFFSIRLLVNGEIGLGDLVIVASIIPVINNVIWTVGDRVVELIKKYSILSAALTELQAEEECSVEGAGIMKGTNSQVKFSHVDFNYPGTVSSIFSDFNLEIKSGQKVGIVGSSGAGKSTLIKLLLRQYDADSGEIMIGDQNIKDVTLESLRQSISFVPQDTTLFHRSLFENIQYAKPETTLEEVIEVSKRAHTHDFIQSLPEQYDTLVGERGVKLSGGQRQRIAIARAMLKDAPILVLDEATSALDGESEQIVQAGFSELFAGRTVIAVAHRLSTLREMDRIVVVEEGKIVEDGSPAELLKIENGVFKQKWEQQKGGFV